MYPKVSLSPLQNQSFWPTTQLTVTTITSTTGTAYSGPLQNESADSQVSPIYCPNYFLHDNNPQISFFSLINT